MIGFLGASWVQQFGLPLSAVSSRAKTNRVFGTGGIPFNVGAAFTLGGAGATYYHSCNGQALVALEKYTHLLLLYWDANLPTQRWDGPDDDLLGRE